MAKYVGESARSAKERFGEHWDDARKGKQDSHIFKHWQNQHGGTQTLFKFKIISFHFSALDRQIAEAVRISRTGAEKILNSKGQYNRCQVPRIVMVDTREVLNFGDTPAEAEQSDEAGNESEHVDNESTVATRS